MVFLLTCRGGEIASKTVLGAQVLRDPLPTEENLVLVLGC